MEKNKWKTAAVVTALLLVVTITAAYMLYTGKECTECDTSEPYNSGYLQGIRDVFDDAYSNGIAMIPFNETHSMALVPWERE